MVHQSGWGVAFPYTKNCNNAWGLTAQILGGELYKYFGVSCNNSWVLTVIILGGLAVQIIGGLIVQIFGG